MEDRTPARGSITARRTRPTATARTDTIVGSRRAIIAVSYTHLDVYKRQGSVFMKKTGAKGWLSLTPGQSGTKALDENVELAKGESIVFRIYLEIPEGASVLFPENTVSASLAYDKEPERKFAIRASASITINEDVQKASIDKEVYAVARELKEEGGHVYLKGAKWNNPVLGSGTGLAEDETTLTVDVYKRQALY